MADVVSSDGHCTVRLHTNWASVLVWTDLTGTITVRRNGIDMVTLTPGRMIWYDHYFTPLGSPSAYTVTNGTTTSTAATITVPADPQRRTWLKSAVNPNLSLAVSTAIGPLPDIAQTQRMGVFDVIGSPTPFVIFGAFTARGTNIQVRARTAAQRDGVIALLTSAAPFFYQPDGSTQESNMWVAASGVKRNMVTGGPSPWWELTIPVVEVAQPPVSTLGNVIPGWGWDNVRAQWATWNALKAANSTWTDLVKFGVS